MIENRIENQEYLKNPLQNSHISFDCDRVEVECFISSLEVSKSSGPYSIPANVLQILKRTFLSPSLKFST